MAALAKNFQFDKLDAFKSTDTYARAMNKDPDAGKTIREKRPDLAPYNNIAGSEKSAVDVLGSMDAGAMSGLHASYFEQTMPDGSKVPGGKVIPDLMADPDAMTRMVDLIKRLAQDPGRANAILGGPLGVQFDAILAAAGQGTFRSYMP